MIEFINELTEKFTKNLQEQSQKLLLQDIIAIYNGVYSNYIEYWEHMINFNKFIEETNIKNMENNQNALKWNFNYYIKHEILSELEFNYIIELSKCYITGVGK